MTKGTTSPLNGSKQVNKQPNWRFWSGLDKVQFYIWLWCCDLKQTVCTWNPTSLAHRRSKFMQSNKKINNNNCIILNSSCCCEKVAEAVIRVYYLFKWGQPCLDSFFLNKLNHLNAAIIYPLVIFDIKYYWKTTRNKVGGKKGKKEEL